jgi:hypothetical protein
VAARTRKTFDGPCRKCGECSHKAREWESAKVKSKAAKVENNPPEEFSSMPLEGRRTGASTKLSEVPNDEMTTAQSTWMPQDESPSGEVHGVARSHEEAAGVDVEGGEADERIRTSDDEESQARERIDDRETEMASQPVDDEAADTPDPHAKCAEPTRPVGTSHDPADELPGEREDVEESESVSMPIEGRSGRMATDRADEPRSLGDDPSDMLETPEGGGTDCGQGSGDDATNGASGGSQRVTPKSLAEEEVRQCPERLEYMQMDSPKPPEPPDKPSIPPEGREDQSTTGNAGARVHQPNGAQTDSLRRHDGVTTSARQGAQSAARADSTNADHRERHGDAHARGQWQGQVERRVGKPKMLTTNESRQHPKRPEHESNNSPTASDNPAQRRTQSPSVELEGERRAASSCDVERVRGEADASGAPGRDQDDRKRLMKLLDMSVCVSKRSKPKGRKYSPGRTRVEPDDPGDDADVSAASGRVEDDWRQPKNLRNASEHERKRSKRRSREDSPDKARGDPDRPDGETAVPDDSQSHQERPRSVSNERVDEANAPRRRNNPGSHLGEPEASRGVEGVWDRGTVVDSAEHDGISPSRVRNGREVDTNARDQRTRPGGHMGEPKASRDVEGDWSRESDGDGVGYHGERGKMEGVTSGACGDSKRVDPRPLADREGQHQRFTRNETAHVPEPSTPPTNDHKRSTELPDPPRRRGKLKSRTKRIRRSKMKKSTYRIVRPRRGQSRRIERIGYVEYEVQMLGEHPGKIPAQHDTAEVEDTRSRALSIIRAATYHIWTPLDAAAHGRWTLLIVHSILIHFIGI